MPTKTSNHLLQEVMNIFKERSIIHQEIGEMTYSVFEILRSKIYNWTGIYFINEKKYLLEARITKRLIELGNISFEAYITQLNDPVFLQNELPKLYTAITINETYFFRCPEHIDTFREIVIPDLIFHKQKNSLEQKITIWSAGCSSGEEAYTLAIIIKEEIQHLYPHIEFEILATDIDEKVINVARKGLFTEYSVRHVPAVYFSKYFHKEGSSFQLSEDIRSMVRFTTLNLYNQEEWRQLPLLDCIFCCNVLIYFDEQSKKNVIHSFYKQMNVLGYLFVGYSESLYGIDHLFARNYELNSLAYKKNETNLFKDSTNSRNLYEVNSTVL